MKLSRYPLLFTNPAGHLQADPAGLLRATWHAGPRTLPDLQQLFEQILGQLRHHGWSCVLINQTAMPPFNGVEQAWVATDWLPRAVRDGHYRYGAVVASPNLLTQLATDYIITDVQGLTLTYRSFATEAAALGWLLRQVGAPTVAGPA